MPYQLTDDDVSILQRMRNMLRSVQFVGMGGSAGPDTLVIGPPFLPQQLQQTSSGSVMVAMKVVGNAMGPGVYTVDVPTTAPKPRDVTTALSLPDDGEKLPSSSNAYFENVAESGISNSHWIPANAWVVGYAALLSTDSPPMPIYRGYVVPPGVWFAVTVVQSTGSNGTVGPPPTAPTYQYDVYLSGVKIATGLVVLWARQLGPVTAGTNGAAFYDAGGTLHLAMVDEVYTAQGCS